MRNPSRTLSVIATAAAVATLSACGGGDDNAPNGAAPLSGPVGQLVAMGPDLLASGTYTVVGCVDTNQQPVSRKIRLNDNGSLQWLDASNNDAVLVSYTPGNTVRDQRFFTLSAGGDYWLSAAIYVDRVDGAPTAAPRAAPRAQAVVIEPSEASVNFNIRAHRVEVNTNTGINDYCLARNLSNPSSDNVVTIPVVLNDAIAARRLASAIALNNNNQALTTTESIDYTDSSDSRATMSVSRTVATNGQISSTVDGTTTAWGNWIAATVANANSNGSYSESWYARNATGTRSPSNPQVYAELAHPTLTYGNGWNLSLVLENSTTGATPFVSLQPLNEAR